VPGIADVGAVPHAAAQVAIREGAGVRKIGMSRSSAGNWRSGGWARVAVLAGGLLSSAITSAAPPPPLSRGIQFLHRVRRQVLHVGQLLLHPSVGASSRSATPSPGATPTEPLVANASKSIAKRAPSACSYAVNAAKADADRPAPRLRRGTIPARRCSRLALGDRRAPRRPVWTH